MRYKELVITCGNKKELVALQKHLFKYRYSWYTNSTKHKQLKSFYKKTYIIIGRDDALKMSFSLNNVVSYGYKILDYIVFMRIEKLKNLKNL